MRKFAALSAEWWNPGGPFRALHALNVARVAFIRDAASEHFGAAGPAEQAVPPLHGLRVVDVGCGGGILAESLARLGAHVTGVDATAENIVVARAHAALDPLVNERVRCATTPPPPPPTTHARLHTFALLRPRFEVYGDGGALCACAAMRRSWQRRS